MHEKNFGITLTTKKIRVRMSRGTATKRRRSAPARREEEQIKEKKVPSWEGRPRNGKNIKGSWPERMRSRRGRELKKKGRAIKDARRLTEGAVSNKGEKKVLNTKEFKSLLG